MKKFVTIAISCVLALGAVMGFAACGGGEGDDGGSGSGKHTHTYATAWSYDKETHWHAATCADLDVDDEGYKKDEAAHGTPNAEGKCPTCGYQIKGTMTLAQFKAAEGSGEKIRDYARRNAGGPTEAAMDFVWGTADGNNKLSSLFYLYFDASGKAGIWSMLESDLDVTLDAIAAGTAGDASGGFGGTGGIVSYDLTAQTGKDTLGAAVFAAYQTNPAEDAYKPAYTAPMVRLVKQVFSEGKTAEENITNVYVLDIFETGFAQYRLVVSTIEEQTDEQLIELLQDSSNITRYVGSGTYATRGELLYSHK